MMHEVEDVGTSISIPPTSSHSVSVYRRKRRRLEHARRTFRCCAVTTMQRVLDTEVIGGDTMA